MKILREPKYKIISCDCGGVFIPEYADTAIFNLMSKGDTRLCKCPFCRTSHEVELDLVVPTTNLEEPPLKVKVEALTDDGAIDISEFVKEIEKQENVSG